MDRKEVMVQFWDELACDNAPHFIATDVTSHDHPDLDTFLPLAKNRCAIF
jgi:hypothetical protein